MALIKGEMQYTLLHLSLISPNEVFRKGKHTDKDNLKLILEYTAFMIVISIFSAGKECTKPFRDVDRLTETLKRRRPLSFPFHFLPSIMHQSIPPAPSSRAVQNLQMPHPWDWHGGQMPRRGPGGRGRGAGRRWSWLMHNWTTLTTTDQSFPYQRAVKAYVITRRQHLINNFNLF